jgi:hypothetical protein
MSRQLSFFAKVLVRFEVVDLLAASGSGSGSGIIVVMV